MIFAETVTFNVENYQGCALLEMHGAQRKIFISLSKKYIQNLDSVVAYRCILIFLLLLAIANNTHYFNYGKNETYVTQGGEAPACFANDVADHLVYGEVNSKYLLVMHHSWKFSLLQ